MAYTQTNDIARMLEAGITDVFTENFNTYPIEWTSYCTELKADKLTMKYDSMGNISGAGIKTEGDEITYRKIDQAYPTTVSMKTVANGIKFTMEAETYDLYKVTAEAQAQELARTMAQFQDERAIRWVDNAESAAYALADGVALASNSHPCKNATGVFNDTLATASSLTDPENHKTMIKMFADFKNHAGGKMKAYPTKGLTHRYNMMDIEEIYKSTNKANEFSNTKNVLPSIQWAYSTYMSNTTAWMMMDNRYKHIIFVRYRGIQKNSGQDKEKTLNFWYNVNEIYETSCLPNVGVVYNPGA